MGLDWIAFAEDENGKWDGVGVFRGKGVSYDKNILDAKPLMVVPWMTWEKNAVDICYGDNIHKHNDINDLPYMHRNEKWCLITLIDDLLKKPPCDIKLESPDDTYQEWRDFMEDASYFLKENERVFCWY
tara:strand:+ start:109 stop:495 length:387 start_codon:yes stop_codon:yes gene_type:complete